MYNTSIRKQIAGSRAAAVDRRERNKRSRMEEAEVERQIEEDQAKLAEDSDGRTSEKPL